MKGACRTKVPVRNSPRGPDAIEGLLDNGQLQQAKRGGRICHAGYHFLTRVFFPKVPSRTKEVEVICEEQVHGPGAYRVYTVGPSESLLFHAWRKYAPPGDHGILERVMEKTI